MREMSPFNPSTIRVYDFGSQVLLVSDHKITIFFDYQKQRHNRQVASCTDKHTRPLLETNLNIKDQQTIAEQLNEVIILNYSTNDI